jgi:sugar/nucleoside kinase (ribokinase family)
MLDAAALQTIARQQFVHTSCFSYLDDRLADLQAAAPLLGYDISTRWTDAERLARVANAADIVVLSLGERRREQGAVLADALMEHGCQLAIMTMGADGALLWNPAIGFVHIPAEPVQIVDTLGAGDAFATAAILSLLAHGWRRGMTVKEKVLLTAGRFAAGIAAAVCCLDGAFGHGRHID